MDNPNSAELCQIAACVGLANNLAAIRAISTEGINKGHMKLHAYVVAYSVEKDESKADVLVKMMQKTDKISFENAQNFLRGLKKWTEHNKKEEVKNWSHFIFE